MQYVANPRVTFNITTSNQLVGPLPQRALIIGQMKTGTATAGALTTNMPRTDAEINTLFGATSHIAMMARAYREVNPITNVDCIALADNGSGTAATASVAFSGTATAGGTIYVTVVSDEWHKYEIDVVTGDTAAALATRLNALITADHYVPFTASVSMGTITFTAANKGLHANDWLLRVTGYAAGISYVLTGWASGATNPSLTSLFDPVQTIRYQTVVWPASYTLSSIANFLNARKNVSNQVLDGMAYTYQNVAFGTILSTASGLNSSEVCILTNAPTSDSNWIGPHLPEAPDVIAAKVAAAFDLRREPGADISSVIVTNAPLDQYGGLHMNSLPAFNTPLIGVGVPEIGTGYIDAENVELANSGVSVLGANRDWNAVITGTMVTTWLNDAAGNPDDTWKYVEWRWTHGAIREFFQVNCQKRFRQSRLTAGTAVAGYDMADQAVIQAYHQLLYTQLTQVALTQAGLPALQFFKNNLSITLVPEQRLVQVAAIVPMVSQFGVLNGNIQYTFETA